MYFLIVETKGYTLEEIAVLFDGEQSGFTKMNNAQLGGADEKVGASSIVKEVDEESA